MRFGSRLLLFNELLLAGVLVVLCVAIGIGAPQFLTGANLLNILRDASMTVIAGIGMTMLLIAGEVDLSIGALVAFVGVVVMDVTNKTRSLVLGLGAGLLLGALVGIANGLVRTKLKVNSLIGTIAMMMILQGAVYLYSGAAVQNQHGLAAFYELGNGYVWFLPIPMVIMAVLWVGFLVIVNGSVFGRRLYAIGGNPIASRISGIKVDAMKIGTFVLCSVLAAVAGIILVSKMNSGQPNAGLGFELAVIAGVILGGTSLTGGEGSLVGTLIGILILRVIENGIVVLGWDQDLIIVVYGAVIVLAVYLDGKRKSARARIVAA